MAQLIEIQKVTVGPRVLDAQVEMAPGAPLLTSDDPEGTDRILALMPELANHLCLGDADRSFGNVVRDTEVAHLLEHVTVELVARTGLADRVSSGQTAQLDDRTFLIRLDCPDDVLVTGALSSAEWMLEWAYSGGGEPRPNVEAIVDGLRDLVASVSGGEQEPGDDPAAEDDEWTTEEASAPRRNP